MQRTTAFLLALLLGILCLMSCAAAEAPAQPAEAAAEDRIFKDTGIPCFPIISEDLNEGVWDDAIAKTTGGLNQSPQLAWEPVEGAACYVIYMVDTGVMDFMHWISNNVTETELPRGWAPAGEYIGPYPPAFETHTYDIYVLALREPVENLKSVFNAANVFFAKNVLYLNEPAEGISGNILAYGTLSGTYTNDN